MAIDWLGYLFKGARPAVDFLLPRLKLERARSGSTEGYPHSFEFLAPVLDEAIQFLAHGCPPFAQSPWGWLKYRTAEPPENLRTPTARDWLAKAVVQAAAKSAIRSRVAKLPADEFDQELLQQWAIQSGEKVEASSGIVHDLLAFMALSANRYLPDSQKVALEFQNLMLERVSTVLHHELQKTRDLIEETRSVTVAENSWIDHEVRRQLQEILRKRFLPGVDVLVDLTTLQSSIASGALRGASSILSAQVQSWRARTFAGQEKPEEARATLNAARLLWPEGDFAIPEARVLVAERRVQEAYRLLRDRQDVDALTAFLVIVYITDGKEESAQYYATNRTLFSPISIQAAVILFEVFSEKGRWDECKQLLHDLSSDLLDESPALRAVVAAQYLAQAAPPEQRLMLLGGGLPLDPTVIRFRDDASSREAMRLSKQHFDAASAAAKALGAEEAEQIYHELALWAWLANPETADHARLEIAKDMKAPERAYRLVRLAVPYNIAFDVDDIGRYLSNRRKFGGWSPQEMEAALLLALKADSPNDVLQFIATYRAELVRRFPEALIVALEIQGLAQLRRIEAAKDLLRRSTSILDEAARLKLDLLTGSLNEKNDVAPIKAIYDRTESVEDLDQLIRALGRAKDWTTLLPYARTMFKKTLQVNDAIVVCDALQGTYDDDGLFEFLSGIPDVVQRSVPLKRRFAWSLFREGLLAESLEKLGSVPLDDWNSNDRNLNVNLAIESGDWERLGEFVETEWKDRALRSAPDLLRAAMIAAEVDSGRVLEFAEAAIAADPDNADILVGAYGLAVEVGAEDEVRAEWFKRAIQQSGPSGPIQTMSLQDLADMQPSWQKQVEAVSRAIVQGSVPLFVAARGLRTTLMQIMFAAFYRNSKEQDPRRRSFIPISHASAALRQPAEAASVVLDLTALFTLFYLGLLEKAIGAYALVYIAPGTLGQLLTDRKRLRFHQPSRLRQNAVVRRLVDQGQLTVVSDLGAPEVGLEVKAGLEFAQLVGKAIRDGGSVIRPAPLHEIGSLAERDVDVSRWRDHIFDTHELVAALRDKGAIGEREEQQATKYLLAHDRRWGAEIRSLPSGVILLDSLTVTYLLTVGLLSQTCRAWSQVCISRETFESFTDLDHGVAEIDEIIAHVDELRKTLQRCIADGRLRISRRRRESSSEDDIREFPTMFMLSDMPTVDAVVVDDRFVNRLATMTDTKGQSRPIMCSANVVDDLYRRQIIPESEWRDAKHSLRIAGAGLIPLSPGELAHHIAQAKVVGEELKETRELRAIREAFSLLAMVQALDAQTEGAFVAVSLVAVREAIVSVWHSKCSEHEAVTKATWLYGLLRAPTALVRADQAERARPGLDDLFATHSALLSLAPALEAARVQAYSRWIGNMLRRQAESVGEEFLARVAAHVKGLVEEIANRRLGGDVA